MADIPCEVFPTWSSGAGLMREGYSCNYPPAHMQAEADDICSAQLKAWWQRQMRTTLIKGGGSLTVCGRSKGPYFSFPTNLQVDNLHWGSWGSSELTLMIYFNDFVYPPHTFFSLLKLTLSIGFHWQDVKRLFLVCLLFAQESNCCLINQQ